MKILIKSAIIVEVSDPKLHLKKRDILIEDGVLTQIASRITAPENSQIIRLPNLHVSRGWFDTSVSFGEPGYEERETIENGLKVAALSGFTDVVLNSNTNPVPDSSGDIVFLTERYRTTASRLHPLGALTRGSEGKDLAELFDMHKAGACGFYDYKQAIQNSNLLKIALQYGQVFGGLICSYPLDGNIAGKGVVNEGVMSTRLGLKGIPAMAEYLQVSRDLSILEYTGGSLHLPTISTAESVRLIGLAKKKGLDISCSVPLHNLYFTDEVLDDFDSNTKVTPPLRTTKDSKALIKGLREGVIDFVTTDHTPLDIEEKRIEFDLAMAGTIGLESAFGIMNQLFDLETTITLLTKGRERFGIKTSALEPGQEANLTLFNPQGESTFKKEDILSRSKNSMFLNAPLHGEVYGAISNKQIELKDSINIHGATT